MRNANKSILTDNRGFTLVEIAIVLIIIGLILGAVVKGKNIIRGAEQKKVYTKFINEWRTSYLNFYDRTGIVLGDTYDISTASVGQDGQADTAAGAAGAPSAAGQEDLTTGDAGTPPLYLGLQHVGIEAPVTNLSNNYEYRYTDSEGGSHILTIAFVYEPAGGSTYNYMWITGIPNELAISIDNLVDGSVDGADGDLLNATIADNQPAGVAWGTNDASPTVETIARWKMEF